MAFRKAFRKQFGNEVLQRYIPYSQAIHPLTFDPVKLVYRRAFSDDEWDALTLLRERRSEAINSSKYMTFMPNKLNGVAGGLGSDSYIKFVLPENMPLVSVKDEELDTETLREVFMWYLTAHRLKMDGEVLKSKANVIVNICNTPGQVREVWPALVHFLERKHRRTVLNRCTKSKLPHGVNDEWIENFTEGDQFERIDHALTVMAITDYEKVSDYPILMY